MELGIVYTAVNWILHFAELAIIIRVILSWVNITRENIFIKFIFEITEPILAPIRKVLEKTNATKNIPVDFSPLIAILIIGLLRNLIVRLLF